MEKGEEENEKRQKLPEEIVDKKEVKIKTIIKNKTSKKNIKNNSLLKLSKKGENKNRVVSTIMKRKLQMKSNQTSGDLMKKSVSLEATNLKKNLQVLILYHIFVNDFQKTLKETKNKILGDYYIMNHEWMTNIKNNFEYDELSKNIQKIVKALKKSIISKIVKFLKILKSLRLRK